MSFIFETIVLQMLRQGTCNIRRQMCVFLESEPHDNCGRKLKNENENNNVKR